MSETTTTERRTIKGFPHLITRDGHIYSLSGKLLFAPTGAPEDSKVELRLPGDDIGKLYDLAKLIKRAFNA
jgi:hypothetical protein